MKLENNRNAACAAEPKWFANINDVPVPAPRRMVTAGLLKQLAGISESRVLVRDHNDKKSDIHLSDADSVDLAEGNVFYDTNTCAKTPPQECNPAKLSVLVDDIPKIILKKRFPVRMLREIYLISGGKNVIRDLESPNDQVIDPDDKLVFADGPVFVTRQSSQIRIFVNTRPKIVEQAEISYTEVVGLAYPNPDFNKYAYTVTYEDGCPGHSSGQISKGESVAITQGMKFDVGRSDKS